MITATDLAVGLLSGPLAVYLWRAAKVMIREPEKYREMALGSGHPLAAWWALPTRDPLIRCGGVAVFAIAAIGAIGFLATVAVLVLRFAV